MANVNWGAGICILPQTAFGTINATVRDAAVTVGETEGAVLGLDAQGTGDSGITIPTHVREAIEKPDVPGSFTRTQNAFVRSSANGLQIIFDLKGNGDVVSGGAPTVDQAKPLNGIDAIFWAAGLLGATQGVGPYRYIPSTKSQYATVKLFLGNSIEGVAYTYQDCLVETLSIPNVGGEATTVTASIAIGSIFQVQSLVLPTFDYGTQATTSPPTNQLADFAWGTTRCHQTLEVAVANTIESFPCSNEANGTRLDQSDREIGVTGSIMAESTDTDYEWTQLIGSSPATATWQYGAGTGAQNPDAAAASDGDIFNRVSYSCAGVIVNDLSYDRSGSKLTAEIAGRCSAASAGAEFFLQFE